MEPCGRAAAYYVLAPNGGRVYACIDHLAHAKAQAGSGALIHPVATSFSTGPHETPTIVD